MLDKPYDKLDHFLSAYTLTDARLELIRSRVYHAGLHPDDPMAILIAQDAIIESRLSGVLTALRHMPYLIEQSASTLSTDIVTRAAKQIDKRDKAFLDNLRKKVGTDMDTAMRQSVAKADVRFFQRAALKLGILMLLIAVIFGPLGYALGRLDTRNLNAQYEHIATRPDAQAWLGMIESNPNLNGLLVEHCIPGGPLRSISVEGMPMCSVPLKLAKKSAPGPTGVLSYISALSILFPSNVFAWVLICCSLVTGIIIGILSKQAFLWVRNGNRG